MSYIIKVTTPYHTFITSCILGLLFRIHDCYEYLKNNTDIHISYINRVFFMYFAFIFILFFWTLVFDEVIELKCCGLNVYTQRNIDKRSELYENRQNSWMANKGVGDADCTMVEGPLNEEYQSEGSNEDDAISMATLTTVHSQYIN